MEQSVLQKSILAPCGINCVTCIGYQRQKRKCPGCLDTNYTKPVHCVTCRILNCENLKKSDDGFFVHCNKFPCQRLKQLNKRYTLRYRTSLLGNIELINRIGVEEYKKNEIKRWSCPDCGSVLSVHRENCEVCGFPMKTGLK
jgi:hypothetical protein